MKKNNICPFQRNKTLRQTSVISTVHVKYPLNLDPSAKYVYLSECISLLFPKTPIFIVLLHLIQHFWIKSPDCDVMSRKPWFKFPQHLGLASCWSNFVS